MKMQKHVRILFLFVLFLFIAIEEAPAFAASDVIPPSIPATGDIWDGSIEQPTTLVQRDGIYYYEITKCSQFAYVAQTGGDWLTYNYILGNNLILNDVMLTWDEDGNCTNTEELLKWTPIGRFSGSVLGSGYIISGMYITSANDGVGFFEEFDSSVINGIVIVNSYVCGNSEVGGLAGRSGHGNISNCSYSGIVKGIENHVGGLIGNAVNHSFIGLTNYATVLGANYVGGISGEPWAGTVVKCCNYGNICGSGDYVGGIAGGGRAESTRTSCNYGTVHGNSYVGGIVGIAPDSCDDINNFNCGTISGESYVGGIAGKTESSTFKRCYNLGAIYCTHNICGTLIGNSDHIWGRTTVENCYYLGVTAGTLNPFGNVYGDTAGVAEGLTDAQMKQRDSFVGWDFNETWAIDPSENGGYPYLSWQTPGAISVSGVSLNKDALDLSVGDQEYLTAIVLPATADDASCVWASSDEQVASVSQSGKVTAIAPGSAEISVTARDGGYTAACSVTVSGRTLNEYRINSVTLKDSNGEILRQIPSGNFWASVSITNQASSGDTLVLLASYDRNGRYLDIMCAQSKDLPIGTTIELSFLMKNSTAQTASIKAFLISSLTDLTPIGKAVSWQP